MPTPEHVRAVAYFDTTEQQRIATEIFRESDEDVQVFDACVQGWTTPDRLPDLVEHGLLVDLVDAPSAASGEELWLTVVESRHPAGRAARLRPAGAGVMRGDVEPANTPEPEDEEATSANDQDALEALTSAAAAFPLGDAAAEGVPTTRGDEPADSEPGATPTTESAADVERVYRVRMNAILGPEDRATLSAAGARLLATEPPATFLAYMDARTRRQVEGLPFVEATVAPDMSDSVTGDLLDVVHAARRLSGQDRGPGLLTDDADEADVDIPDQYDLICHRPEDVPLVRDLMASTNGIEVVDTSDVIVRIQIRLPVDELTAALGSLASQPNIRTVSPYRAPRLLCDRARRLIGVEAINADQNPPRWTGEGERVAIFDSGVDDRHPDLESCVVHKEGIGRGAAIDRVGHGTHVAGIVAASGASSDGRIKGVAPGAELVVFGIVAEDGSLDLPADLGKLLSRAVDQGAKVINLSWGNPLPGPYDGYSLTIDRFVRSHPDVLVVVAAGNEGSASPPSGLPPFRTIDTPASAKNVVTVGACATDRREFDQNWGTYSQARFRSPPTATQLMAGDPDVPAALSSRGPTEFMSVKPDVLAPGTFILSTRAQNFSPQLPGVLYPHLPDRYVYLHGTSMAAPVVSGAAAIIRQYLRVARGLAEPSAALVKAMLIASAHRVPSIRPEGQDVGYPDFDQGFGRIDLSSILPIDRTGPGPAFVDVPNGSADALEALTYAGSGRKGKATYLVTVEEGWTAPLNVVLTWTDYAAAYVQNNLELVVKGPGVPIVVGNPESKYGRSDLDLLLGAGNEQLAGAIPDRYNSVEQVLIPNPKPGEFRIIVVAQNTPFPEGGQGYALVVVGGSTAELGAA